MKLLHMAFTEVIGMFIDDGALATWSLVLIVVVGVLAETHVADGTIGATILCLGTLGILAESVLRAARSKPPR